MNRFVPLMLALLFVVSCRTSFSAATDARRLAEVRRVYVGSFGPTPDAERVRHRVREILSQSTRFTIMDDESAAEAILGGVAGVKQIETSMMQTNDDFGLQTIYETHRVGFGRLGLIAAGLRDTVWTFRYRPGASREKTVTRIANHVVRGLLADAAAADATRAAPRGLRP
ncbi:MAG TPA: hypothetical protein VNO75_07710 [Gemmatimonadaceae bacterium]|nr:hypothetical protein [Gemmatimonadaceae bacterium]